MREIKFRGKRIYDNEWVFGNLVTDKYGEMHIIPGKYFYEDGHHLVYDDGTDRPVFIHQETVGQYTEITDSKHKEIYDGDIVKFKYSSNVIVGVVRIGLFQSDNSGGEYCANRVFGAYIEAFRGFRQYSLSQLEIDDIVDYVEVIGNVHDIVDCVNFINNVYNNPELL